MSRELVASFFTLTGNGFGEPPRHDFAAHCRAAADAGFVGIGVHVDAADRVGLPQMRAMLADTGLRVVEVEFITGWATGEDTSETERRVYRVAEVLRRAAPARIDRSRPAEAGRPTPLSHRVCGIARRNRFRVGFGVQVPLRTVAAVSLGS